MSRKGILAIAVGLTAMVSLTGCGPSAEARDTTVTFAQVVEPHHILDPIVDGSLAGNNYYYSIFDQLTTFNAEGELQPRLATSWQANEDFTVWTYKLRNDVKFHNGNDLTATDVAFTYNTIMDTPDSSPRTYMTQLDNAEAIDEETVKFTLNTSFSAWPSTTTAVSIVPEDVYKELGSKGFSEELVGSGPFTFDHYTRGVEFVAVKNSDYWGDVPEVDKVVYTTVTNQDARLSGVLSDSLDIALLPPYEVEKAKTQPSVQVKETASNSLVFLGMNSQEGPLADENIRRAISLAIDRDEIVEKVLGGGGTPNNQMIAPNVAGYNPDFPHAQHDPKQAAELVEKSGYSGEQIPFEYATEGIVGMGSEVAPAIAGWLREIGLNIDLQGMDAGSMETRVYAEKSMKGIYLLSYGPAQLDGDPVIANMFAGQQNDYAERDDTKELVIKTREVEGSERIAAYSKLFTLNEDENLLIGLYTPTDHYAVSNGLSWTPRVDGRLLAAEIKFTD